MCKAPKPPKPKEPKKPQFLRNRYLDEYVGESAAVNSIKAGRGSLRIPMGSPTPISGRQPGDSLVSAAPVSPRSGQTQQNPFQLGAIGPRGRSPDRTRTYER